MMKLFEATGVLIDNLQLFLDALLTIKLSSFNAEWVF